jgi:hypothetical protein
MYQNTPKQLEEKRYGDFLATASHAALSALLTEITQTNENTEDRATPSAGALRDLRVSMSSANQSELSPRMVGPRIDHDRQAAITKPRPVRTR